ncbi:MAG: family 78 glycoside hydrolase catalytic domain [Parabacteroides sp.]
MNKLKLLMAVFGLGLMACSASKGDLDVSQLRVEHCVNPSVVDAQAPRFSWVNTAKDEQQRGAAQTAYQIGVSSTLKKLKAGDFDVWDSGKQLSEESSLVPYGGSPLQSGADYYWCVRTWDQADQPSAWSQPAHWGMGLLHATDWKAHWIDSDQQDGGAPLLRKRFTVEQPVKEAKAYICGLGFFELYINGERIGEDYLVPNLANYTPREGLEEAPLALHEHSTDFRIPYMRYDVSGAFQQGENAVGVILGNGFYEPDHRRAGRYGHPCLLLQIELTLADGTKQTVVSDGSWLTKPSAIRYNGIYKGECYDGAAETPDWSVASCDEQGWKAVRLAEGPKGRLVAQTAPNDRITEILQPLSLKQIGADQYEVDFGKEIAGWIRLKELTGNQGDSIQVRYVSESPQGTQCYLLKGEGKESYAPRFTWFAFSRAVISGVRQLDKQQVQAEAVNTDLGWAAEFRTSNPLYNKINEIWRRAQLDNMHGCIASDCPHRERLPYTGDGQAACATVMHNFDAAAFYQKWIADMRDAQDKYTGYVPNGAPWQPGCGGGVGWGAAMNIMPWEYYVQYGDRKMLEDSFEAMKAQVGWMTTWTRPDGTMFQQRTNVGSDRPNYWLNLGDWCPPYGLPKDDLVHTFYLWQCADFTARAAAVLDIPADVTTYRALADRTREAFHARYYDEAAKTYGDYGANVYALVMGVPEAREADVIESLRKEIVETHGGHIHTGFLATKYLLETLSNHGLHDVALEMMNKEDFPSFGHWIAQGATTTWEQWDGGNSHNHPMFGSGLTWFYRCLAGINADEHEPGFRHIVLRPHLSETLPEVYYAYQTPYGEVVSDISRKGTTWNLKVKVPVGSYATLYLPATDAMLEQGQPLNQSKGVQVMGQENGHVILHLVQGSYDFSF